MTRLCAIALMAPALVVAAPVPKEKEKKLYFPVQVGAKRVLAITVGESAYEKTEVVTKVVVKDGTYTVTVGEPKGARGFARVFEYDLEVSERGIARPKVVGRGGPLTDLKLDGKPGDTWTQEIPSLDHPQPLERTYTLGKVEDVEVPAGRYKAIRVDSETPLAGGRTQKCSEWYAPEVGWVRQEVSGDGKADCVSVLKEFTPGKGDKASVMDEPKKDK